jgi:hypothetical protein
VHERSLKLGSVAVRTSRQFRPVVPAA